MRGTPLAEIADELRLLRGTAGLLTPAFKMTGGDWETDAEALAARATAVFAAPSAFTLPDE